MTAMLTSLSFITSGDPPKLVFDVLDEDEDEGDEDEDDEDDEDVLEAEGEQSRQSPSSI
jgi:hypothetical protein